MKLTSPSSHLPMPQVYLQKRAGKTRKLTHPLVEHTPLFSSSATAPSLLFSSPSATGGPQLSCSNSLTSHDCVRACGRVNAVKAGKRTRPEIALQ